MDLDNLELEFKYNANEISLIKYKTLMLGLNPLEKLDVSSWDYYYTKEDNKEEFQRFRDSDTPELTKKVKKVKTNNWERIESDLPLDPKRVTEERVAFHVGLDGYKKNFKIYKTCFLYKFLYINSVYYIVYNEDLKEQGRFIEIEVNKDKLLEIEKSKLELELRIFEQELTKIGINPKNRLKKSLFEMFLK